MKKVFSLALLSLSIVLCEAQMINLEPASPAPQFQEADVGSLAFGDIDNDGDIDFMATGKGGPVKSTLYRNDGMGNFSEVLGTPFEDLFAGTVGFEDVDNDGDMDLLTTGKNSSPIQFANLYINDGTGNFTLSPNTPFEASEGGDFAFGDVDSDGDSDLILTGYDALGMGFTKLYLNNGSGVFSLVVGTPFEDLVESTVEFIDIENDNDLDIVIAGENNNAALVTSLYENDGAGNFTLVPNTPFDGVSAGDIATADTDNDGDEDILISGSLGGGATMSKLYLNDGTGSFSLLSGTPFPGAMVGASEFADFDNDGDFDVLIVGAGNAVFAHIYQNQGANSFILADSLAGAYLSSIAIGDIDGDNDLDLIIAGTSFTAPVRSTKTYLNLTPTTVGIPSDAFSQDVSIFPNPSNGAFQYRSKMDLPATVKIFNSNGKLVYSKDSVIPHDQIELNQPSGLYVVVVTANGVNTTHHLVLQQ